MSFQAYLVDNSEVEGEMVMWYEEGLIRRQSEG